MAFKETQQIPEIDTDLALLEEGRYAEVLRDKSLPEAVAFLYKKREGYPMKAINRVQRKPPETFAALAGFLHGSPVEAEFASLHFRSLWTILKGAGFGASDVRFYAAHDLMGDIQRVSKVGPIEIKVRDALTKLAVDELKAVYHSTT